ncbi:MAG: hybrid sensor histidine kinase/response regulator, partial [Promethearchaeota archaeon]
ISKNRKSTDEFEFINLISKEFNFDNFQTIFLKILLGITLFFTIYLLIDSLTLKNITVIDAFVMCIAIYIPFFFLRLKKMKLGIFFIIMENILYLNHLAVYNHNLKWLTFLVLIIIISSLTCDIGCISIITLSQVILGFIYFLIGKFTFQEIFQNIFVLIVPTFVISLVIAKTRDKLILNQIRKDNNLKIAQKHIIKQEKLASISTLAGGIAHDFNNILTAILGNLDLIEICGEPGDEIFEYANEAKEATLRAKHLTTQLLTFAKDGIPKKIMNIDMGSLLNNVVNFHTRGSNVLVDMAIDSDLWKVRADETQISQVIQNFVINAIQAMPNGGNLSISAVNYFGEKNHYKSAQPLNGKYVCIIVQDTGNGISSSIIDKIFDPYFTTKKTGTGLGLSISYSIVEQYQGKILVESQENKGTIFTIYLHASKGTVEEKEDEIFYPVSRNGKILIMDDEIPVLSTLSNMLKVLGFKVDVALNGKEAIQKYSQEYHHKQPYDIVIMDLTIKGGMGGIETIDHLKKMDPNINAIVSSGYSENLVIHNYKNYGFKGVLNKPYVLEEVAKLFSDA